MIACVMSDDARACQAAAAVYEAEAERARQWAAIRRSEADNEDRRALRLSAMAARMRAVVPLPCAPNPSTPMKED